MIRACISIAVPTFSGYGEYTALVSSAYRATLESFLSFYLNFSGNLFGILRYSED